MTIEELTSPAAALAPSETTPRSRRSKRGLVAVLLVLAVATGAWAVPTFTGSSEKPAHVSVATYHGRPAILVTHGLASLADLARVAPAVVSRAADGTFSVLSDVVVGTGGHLRLNGVVHLGSNAQRVVALRADGGFLELSGADVTALDDGLPVPGSSPRGAEIIATGHHSRLVVKDSHLRHLGTSPASPGLTWRAGAIGQLKDSVIEGGFRGAYAYQSGISISGTTIRDVAEAGLVLRGATAGWSLDKVTVQGARGDGVDVVDSPAGSLRDLDITGSGSNGVSVSGGSGLRLVGGRIHNNKAAGVLLSDSEGAEIQQATLWSNREGLSLSDTSATVEHNISSGNLQDGLLIRGFRSRVRVTSERYDHNSRAGIWVSDGSVLVTDSVLDRNLTGIRVADDNPAFTVGESQFLRNTKDGLAVTVTPGVTVRRSTFDGNVLAAVSGPDKVDVKPLLANSSTASGDPATRVRTE